MSTSAPTFRGRGYTLIELLAVITIAALAAAFTFPGLADSSDMARCRAAAAQVRDLDRKARLAARAEGQVALASEAETHALVLVSVHSQELIAQRALAASVGVSITVDGEARGIIFDRAGRCPDYDVVVTCGATVERFNVCGATGLVTKPRNDS